MKERRDIGNEIESLDETAYKIVKDLVKGNYSFASMLFFASRIQWLIFNAELVRNEVKSEDKTIEEFKALIDRMKNSDKKEDPEPYAKSDGYKCDCSMVDKVVRWFK